jgi:hypothetical protein
MILSMQKHGLFLRLLVLLRWEYSFTSSLSSKGAVLMQSHRVKQPWIQSDVPILYNKGGIRYDKTDMTLSIKGWRDKVSRASVPHLTRSKKTMQKTPNLKGAGWKQIKRHKRRMVPHPKSANANYYKRAWSYLTQRMKTALYQSSWMRHLWNSLEVRVAKKEVSNKKTQHA